MGLLIFCLGVIKGWVTLDLLIFCPDVIGWATLGQLIFCLGVIKGWVTLDLLIFCPGVMGWATLGQLIFCLLFWLLYSLVLPPGGSSVGWARGGGVVSGSTDRSFSWFGWWWC